eukprot:2699376-Rhodomonas_salina.3
MFSSSILYTIGRKECIGQYKGRVGGEAIFEGIQYHAILCPVLIYRIVLCHVRKGWFEGRVGGETLLESMPLMTYRMVLRHVRYSYTLSRYALSCTDIPYGARDGTRAGLEGSIGGEALLESAVEWLARLYTTIH